MGGLDEGYKYLLPKPSKLLISEEVNMVMVSAGYLSFMEIFYGYDVNVSHQIINSQVEVCVSMGCFMFEIIMSVLVEIISLPDDGLKIQREKYPQKKEMDFFSTNEIFSWDGKYILREGLQQPWPKLASTVMNYITLHMQMTWIKGYHLEILNQIRWRKKMNMLYFLFKELEKATKYFQKGRMKYALHERLFFIIVKYMTKNQGWLGDPDDFLLRSEQEEKGGEDLGAFGGKWKRKRVREVEGGYYSLLRKGKVGEREDLDYYFDYSPLVHLLKQ